MAAKLAIAKTRRRGVTTSKPVTSKTDILSHEQHEPDNAIYTDQFMVKIHGHLLKEFSWKAARKDLHGGAFVQDAASIIFLRCRR